MSYSLRPHGLCVACQAPSSMGFSRQDYWGGPEAVLRRRRNRIGRPLSPPQIHQKIIWMLSDFHKTTSECWWKTPGTQKGSLFSSKGGRIKYKKQKERQRVRDGDPSREEFVKEKFPNTRKPSHQQVCGEFWNLRGQHNQEGKKKKTTHRIRALTTTPSGEIAQTIASAPSKQGRCGLHA